MSQTPNEITTFFHCRKCVGASDARDIITGTHEGYQQDIEVGWTRLGFQVWCRRHNSNIVHINFLGQKVDFAGPNDGPPEDN